MFDVTAEGVVNGEFVERNLQTGQRGTRLSADDMNRIWRELKSLVTGAGLALNASDYTQVLQAVKSISLGSHVLRNTLINGDFTLNQRTSSSGAISSAGVAAYGLDRWRLDNNNGGSGSIQLSQTMYITPAQNSAFPKPSRALGGLICSGTGLANPVLMMQRIEDVRTLANGKATLSFWVRRATSTTATLTPKLRQYHGPSGAADVTTAAPALVLTDTLWHFYSYTFNVPAIGAIGTGLPTMNGTNVAWAHFLELRFEVSAWTGAGVNLDFCEVQLEPGPAPSLFESRPVEVELLFARRYYEQAFPFGNWLAFFQANLPNYVGASRGQDQGTIAQSLYTRFRVPKAKVPTIKWYSPETGVVDKIRWNSGDITVTQTNHASTEATGEPQTGSSQAQSAVYGLWTADAEI